MQLNTFNVFRSRGYYTLYKWVHGLKNNTSSSLKFTNKFELLVYLKLAKSSLSQCKGKCTITFYSFDGTVVTLVPKDWDRIISEESNLLLSDLIDSKLFWLDIPELIPINDSHTSSWYGLGQLIMTDFNTCLTPIIKSSLIHRYVQFDNQERFDRIEFGIYEHLLENLYLRFRAFYRMMGDLSFDTIVEQCNIDKVIDLVPNFTKCDKSVKYCIQAMSLILEDFSECEVGFVRRQLHCVNVANFDLRYPIEYDIVKVGEKYQLMYYVYEDRGVNVRRIVGDG